MASYWLMRIPRQGLLLRSAASPRYRSMSSSTRTSHKHSAVSADWLRKLLDDDSPPPRLYAWTAANLGAGSGSGRDADDLRSDSSSTQPPRRRIHILGIGNLGRLFAHGLAKLPQRPPITLVVHRRALLEQWLSSPGIEITRAGIVERSSDFDVEWWTDEKPALGPLLEPGAGVGIDNIIVATKASDALPQVDRLRRYLHDSSTVAFVQNGMCKLWPPMGNMYNQGRFPDGKGPSWTACVTTHGVTSVAPFKSIHASPATVSVGPVSLNPSSGDSAQYLMEQIASAPDLAGRLVSKPELWVLQLEKLVVNAVINPLTACLRCKNGELLVPRGDDLPVIVERLIDEAGSVLRSAVLDPSSAEILGGGPTSASDPFTKEALLRRFSSRSLREMVSNVSYKVRENTSSMLQDVQAGKRTEIRDFNGWLVETADLLAQKPQLPTHERLIALVEDGVTATRGELGAHLAVTSRQPPPSEE